MIGRPFKSSRRDKHRAAEPRPRSATVPGRSNAGTSNRVEIIGASGTTYNPAPEDGRTPSPKILGAREQVGLLQCREHETDEAFLLCVFRVSAVIQGAILAPALSGQTARLLS